MIWAGYAIAALAALGNLLVLAAALCVWRFSRHIRAVPPAVTPAPVTLLKPLHGAESRLADDLRTFLVQDWPEPVQLIAGVQRADDPALAAVAPLAQQIECVIDTRQHGANAKVGNLINMMPAARTDLLVVSDSDISVPRDYLARVVGALQQPGVGVVTCVFAGRGNKGLWSRIAAAEPSYYFLPSVLMSVALGRGDACMGSTIALRRSTLDAIGGFAILADKLADDHAIGAAVVAQGRRIALAPVVVTHGHDDSSLKELWRHELRWSATIRDLQPGNHLGLTLLYPLPFALVAAAILGAPGWALVATTIAARVVVAAAVDRLVGRKTMPWILLPLRDLLCFAVHVRALLVRRVEWRGATLTMREEGRIEPRSR